MPDPTNPKSRIAPDPPAQLVPAAQAYAELQVTTNFSLLRGASHADELVFRAAALGYRAIAVTDHNTLAGAVRMHEAAAKCGLKLIIGVRLVLNDSPDVLLWAADRPAYARLCRLLTTGKRRAEKGHCALWLADLLQALADAPGLLAAVVPPEPLDDHIEPVISRLHAAAGGPIADRLSIATSCLYHGTETARLRDLTDLSRATSIPLLATNDVHYHEPERRALQDVLTCIRHLCTVHDAGYRLSPNGERYLKSPAQMHHVFAMLPEAIQRGVQIASRCTFTLDELRYEYPQELVPPGLTITQHLRNLTEAGLKSRYPEGESPKVRRQIEHELKLIEQLKYEAYFLTVHDLVVFARSRGILCQGRGSAANSAVCYCLGVTSVDPNQIDLLFERFVSAARKEPPDIDVDFEHERREEVIQYVYQKYGRQRAGMTAEVITYRGRSAVRDVGKALGLSLDLVDQMAKQLDGWSAGAMKEEQLRALNLDPNDRTIRQVVELTGQLLGFPRHLGQHVGGLIMTQTPLCEMVPIDNAVMADRTVIEWDKDDIDTVGMLKVDVLALGMLTCISKAFGMVEGRHEGTEARRHEGWRDNDLDVGETVGSVDRDGRETSDECDSQLPRPDRLAERNEALQGNLYRDEKHAEGRAVWSDEPDASSGGIYSVEYRRRLCAGEQEGLPEASADCTGIAGGASDAVGTGHGRTGTDSSGSRDLRTCDRRGSNPAGFNPCSPRIEPEPVVPLRASVPSCLRASVPSCLRASSHRLELHQFIPTDPLVYDMICRADTIGVFQIESRAQMSMLPRLRPRSFYDLVIEVAIVRPGPIQGNMVHPYLRRRNGEEEVTYPSEALRDVLKKTLGVPLFQEQAMKVAMVAAGFTADEADQLRKAMAAWRKTDKLEEFRSRIIDGMLARGYTRAFAEQTFEQIRGFGEYGFPESHAASFSLLVYVSSWLKRYHPAAFAAALINSQPMGFYAPAQIIRDAKEHGVPVLAIDVNESKWDCFLEDKLEGVKVRTHEGREMASRHLRVVAPLCSSSADPRAWGIDGPAIRLGFRMVKGLKAAHALKLVEERALNGPFRSIRELRLRTGLSRPALQRLAEADAFGSMGLARREALWQVLGLEQEEAPLFEQWEKEQWLKSRDRETSPRSALPPMPIGQEVMTDYTVFGLSLKSHPVALVRAELEARRVITASAVREERNGKWVRVAGLVLIRQRPGTASGIVFETLEDETGITNLIVRPKVYDQYKQAARYAMLVEAQGIVERQGDVVHVMVKKMEDLTWLVEGLQARSRDFR